MLILNILCYFSGTGKTYTAMKLIHLFRKINIKIHGSEKQIIFCGPSNKSVDLVASTIFCDFQQYEFWL